MANSAPGGASDYNTKIIEEFRANEGRVGGPLGIPLILIHHASHGRSPAHPDWYYNLKAHPRITVEVGTQTFPVLAEELAGAARAALWPTLAAQAPSAGKIAGQDHAADSGVHADPPGLTWSATLRIGGFDSGHLTGSWGTWPGQATPACPACTTT
jgi:deazaflavin-dependent oxidoreductase (nitroreductase family)